jgi:hypothetical protein
MLERLKVPTCTIETLGPPPSCDNGSLQLIIGMSEVSDLPSFSIKEMHKHIVRFIVADDQVCTVYHFCALINDYL